MACGLTLISATSIADHSRYVFAFAAEGLLRLTLIVLAPPETAISCRAFARLVAPVAGNVEVAVIRIVRACRKLTKVHGGCLLSGLRWHVAHSKHGGS